MLDQVTGKDSNTVVDALIRQVGKLPKSAMASLTWDRGTELAYHGKFSVTTDISVYFCDPQSPLSADCFAIARRAMRGSAAIREYQRSFATVFP